MTTRAKLTLLLAITTGMGVLVYNFWSYSCGYCTINSLLTVGPAGYLLLGINLALLNLLLFLKNRRQTRLEKYQCSCGAPLSSSWHYCPQCGNEVA